MRKFSKSVDIMAAPDRVWQVMSDVDRWHEWTPSITSVTRTPAGPLSVGNRAVVRQPKFPPAIWTVTEIDPGRSFTWVSTAPGMRVTARHAVEPTATGTRATLSLDLQGLFGGLFGRMTRDITLHYLDFEAAGLKARSEDPSFGYDHSARRG